MRTYNTFHPHSFILLTTIHEEVFPDAGKTPGGLIDVQTINGMEKSSENSGEKSRKKKDLLDKMSDIMSDKLSKKEIERMKVIISYLLEHDFITTSKAAELLQVGDKTAQRLLSKGEAVGVLDGKGENKGKQYYIPSHP